MTAPKTKRSIWWTALVILFSALFAVSAVMLVLHFLPQAGQPGLVSTPSVPSAPESNGPMLVDNPIDFAALQAKNPEIIGWISIPGTHIDYAILQSGKDTPEDYYLYRDEQGKNRRAGSIYIQKQNSHLFTDPNTVIYGHYMANGSMFADLHQFRKEKFFAENDTILIYTPGHILTYRLYSAFVFDDRHVLNSYNFHDPEDPMGYRAFLDVTLNPPTMHKQVRPGVEVTTADRIITLSTCTTRDTERYLVEGVLISDQLTR